MENSFQDDTVTFVTTTTEQDTDLCPQTRHEWCTIGSELEYLLAKYLPANGDIS